MITKELVDRINFLAKKQRDGGLNEEEKREQKYLREIYIQNIRSQVKDALESAGFKPGKKHPGSCGCGDCGGEEKVKPSAPDVEHKEKGDGPCNCGEREPGTKKYLH